MATLCVADIGLEEISIATPGSKKPKPAYFPHKAHLVLLDCGECHHAKRDYKQQVSYAEGQSICKCIDSHNSEVLPSKTKGKLKLNMSKRAYHANCLTCHNEVAKRCDEKSSQVVYYLP